MDQKLLTLSHLEAQLLKSNPTTEFETPILDNVPVLLRVDFNVPITDDKQVADDTRIRAAIPTIQWLQERGAKIVLMSHLGRPKGTKNKAFSLIPVAEHLQTLLEQEIYHCDVYDDPELLLRDLAPKSIVLLENLRFDPAEENNDYQFAKKLSYLGDYYINDAFGLAHRKHASVSALAQIFAEQKKAFAGLLIEKECEALDKVLHSRKKGTVVVIGGAKVSDKIVLLQHLSKRSEHIIVGGAMAYTFLAAQRTSIGKSRVESDKYQIVRQVLEQCESRGVQVHLPIDHVCAAEFIETAEPVITESVSISEDLMGLDIGPKTQAEYAAIIKSARCIFWNGPMGVFEWENFSNGTRTVAQALNDNAEAYTIVGGGDSAAAVEQMDLAGGISHISTGGGASLAYLEEVTLPGLQHLTSPVG